MTDDAAMLAFGALLFIVGSVLFFVGSAPRRRRWRSSSVSASPSC